MNGPIPARVPGAVKEALLGLVDQAVDAGWTLERICGVLELDRRRAWRWQQRRQSGTLDDGTPGGNPIHGLLDWEVSVAPILRALDAASLAPSSIQVSRPTLDDVFLTLTGRSLREDDRAPSSSSAVGAV